MHGETRQAAPPACGQRGWLSILRKSRNEPGQAPVGKEQVRIAEACSPRACPKEAAVAGRNPAFSHILLQCKAPSTFPVRCLHTHPSPHMRAAPSTKAASLSPSLRTRSPVTQPAAERQTAASLPLWVSCWGTCRACLANEKLLRIPLWAFQEGLARFLQSRHGKTVCFSKYIRDFSGTWLWQGLSAVVSQVVSLLGYTNRKVLSGTDTGLLGLSLSRVPAQIQPRLIASESCYLLTALPRSSHAHSKQRGLRRSFPAEDADPCTADTQAGSPHGEVSRAQIIHCTPQSHHLILLHVPMLQDSGRATHR